jgi:hypothetical protein
MSCFKCFRRFMLMFQVFHLDVAKVDLRCCICCNDNICMLQVYVFKCFRCIFQVFHLDVAYTCMLQGYVYKCFRCLIRMLQVFHLDVAYVLQWLHTCFQVFQTYLQVFQLFRTYVASISFGCCKSRSRAAHVAVGPIYCSRLLQLLGRRACAWEAEGDGGRGRVTGSPRRVKRELLQCCACVECRKWRGMGVGARSRGGVGVRTGGAEVPTCARRAWNEQHRWCPGASHALLYMSIMYFHLLNFLSRNDQ